MYTKVQNIRRNRSSICALAVAFGVTLGSAEPSLALTGGSNDADTPLANATVWVNGCTGTLVTPDTVVSAGHCFGQRQPIQSSNRSSLTCADREIPAQWYQTTGRIEVRVGNRVDRPRFRTTVTRYALPGCRDIIALKLRQAVPAEHATPIKVVTRMGPGVGAEPARALRGMRLVQAGWGLDANNSAVTFRRVTTVRYDSADRTFVRSRGIGGARTNSGDSGGPLYAIHPSGQRFLVGVVQGWDGATGLNRYTPTFSNAFGNAPDTGWFFEQAIPDAVTCDSFADRPDGTVPLTAWWNPARADNHATTNPDWQGCRFTKQDQGYGYVRIEGYIFSPHLPQPEGTVRLNTWFSPRRGDFTTMTQPNWVAYQGGPVRISPDYQSPHLEGYVFDPALPKPPGTIALYRWWSPQRGDNWTTTQHASSAIRRLRLGPDYRFSRLVGYVYPAEN